MTIAGDGPQKKSLQKITANLMLGHYVKFVGKIPSSNLAEFYSRSDIAIFPSIYPEPFGRVALEAMSFGKPVIASRVGGIPEVVEDLVTGILVPPNNPKELATAILTMLLDQQLMRNMGKKGKVAAKLKFSADQSVSKHLQVYNRL